MHIPMSSALSPIRLEIESQPGKGYKSIDNLTWDNIPPLSIITGLNGSGKSQLLELLAFKLTGTSHPQTGLLDGVNVTVIGDTFTADSVAYLPSRWEVTGAVHVGIPNMQQAKDQLWNEYRQHHNQHDIRSVTRRARLQSLMGRAGVDQASFTERLSDDFSFMLEDTDVVAGLAHVLVAHRLRVTEELERGLSREQIRAKLGPAPWEVIDQAFRVADFPYEVVPPTETPLAGTYKLELRSRLSTHQIPPGDLSSGEKMLLVLVLWLYNSKHHGRFPKLFLLDEPDANLHPSMARQFLSVVQDVLVGHYGVRVIMTTHSPSTVALAPEGSVFEMSRANPRIKRSVSTSATVGLLTSGLVVVSPGSRVVLVEDELDVTFYGAVRDILTDYGPSRDQRAIAPTPSIIFLPASRGLGPAKTGGGSSVVTAWVNKFDQAPLNEIVRGVIDRDASNAATPRIAVIGRYSIENYLLDPLVVYCLLSSAKSAPVISGIKLSSGDEHMIREMPEGELAAVLDAIIAIVQPRLTNVTPAEAAPRDVTFTNGKKLVYPGWVLDRRGHDLLPVFQTAFGGPGVINPLRLEQSLRRLRLVPTELADILDQLQRPT